MKALIIDGKIQMLSFDEVYAKYTYLMKWMAKRWSIYGYDDLFDLDDLFQLASIGLLKAYRWYDINKGKAFNTYATHMMKGQLWVHYRDRNRKVRKKGSKVNCVLSLYSVHESLKTDGELIDILVGDEDFTERLIENIWLKEALDNLEDDEKNYVIDNYILGMSQTKIAKMNGTSQASVWRTIERAKKKLKAKIA
jgi:RNA polymerase sigma factor (sigma-70 family)